MKELQYASSCLEMFTPPTRFYTRDCNARRTVGVNDFTVTNVNSNVMNRGIEEDQITWLKITARYEFTYFRLAYSSSWKIYPIKLEYMFCE